MQPNQKRVLFFTSLFFHFSSEIAGWDWYDHHDKDIEDTRSWDDHIIYLLSYLITIHLLIHKNKKQVQAWNQNRESNIYEQEGSAYWFFSEYLLPDILIYLIMLLDKIANPCRTLIFTFDNSEVPCQ